MVRVAYYGEEGSYSEEGARRYFGNKGDFMPCGTFSAVIKMTGKGADYGVMPVENSIEGTVSQAYDLIASSRLSVVGEVKLRVKHELIANKGVSIKDVRYVYSHQQALGQCARYIDRKGFIALPFHDTAGSVRMLKEKGYRDSAAIASGRAARIYNMDILDRAIETDKRNYTRFLVVGKKAAAPAGECKTSVVFRIKHVAGSLYKAIGCFANNGINLTYIQSRPAAGRPWEYSFFVDMEGSSSDKSVRKALEELKSYALFVKVLGSYKAAKNPALPR